MANIDCPDVRSDISYYCATVFLSLLLCVTGIMREVFIPRCYNIHAWVQAGSLQQSETKEGQGHPV